MQGNYPKLRRVSPPRGPGICQHIRLPMPTNPGEFRVVINAAAEFKRSSLNKSLLTGPDLLNSLVGVLIRFRSGKIAIAADIEAMFHQVRVNQDDADSLRFLWKDDITSDEPPDTYQMLVHIFGSKDSPGLSTPESCS